MSCNIDPDQLHQMCNEHAYEHSRKIKMWIALHRRFEKI